MKSSSRKSRELTLTITELGARGDGLGQDSSGNRYYVPFSIPDEEIRIRVGQKRGDGFAAELLEVVTPSPERREPACPHFGRCGGCSLQHVSDPAIAGFKSDLVKSALSRKGLVDLAFGETKTTPPAARRRARFAVRRLQGRAVLGFNERMGKMVLDLEICPVLRPAIEALIPALRTLANDLPALGKGGDIQVTESDTGLEVLFVPDRDADLSLAERERILDFAEKHDIARIAWENDGFMEPVAGRHAVRVSFAGVPVDLPVGCFLQPSRDGEGHIADLVREGVGGAARVADLYCGCGSLTFPIATLPHQPVVFAADGLDSQIGALRKAAAGLKVTAEIRDLARDPLSVEELNKFDAVVFDPPRAGAAPQAEELAKSNVGKIVAVSCNPSTMARDLRILVDGDYVIEKVVPVDQFTWSSHVEAVAILSRPMG